jgi:hypothetical protein
MTRCEAEVEKNMGIRKKLEIGNLILPPDSYKFSKCNGHHDGVGLREFNQLMKMFHREKKNTKYRKGKGMASKGMMEYWKDRT